MTPRRRRSYASARKRQGRCESAKVDELWMVPNARAERGRERARRVGKRACGNNFFRCRRYRLRRL